MKRWAKNAVFRILAIVLFTGLAGILGICILIGNLESYDYQRIFMVKVCSVICICAIAAAVFFCGFICFRILRQVEEYRKQFEDEVEETTRKILEHDRTIMEMQNNTVIGMATLIESRDGESGEHIQKTSAYVELLAHVAKDAGYHPEILNDEYIELLVKAAPMHDIGKISIPERILKKPGRLTEEEFEIMKTHAAKGGELVREVLSGEGGEAYIKIAADVAAYHHEKWNGAGYPKGLQGEGIPLAARIMAVADVFDALVSRRCYKDALPLGQAFDIIEADAGSHFDPTLAKLFLQHKTEVERIAFRL